MSNGMQELIDVLTDLLSGAEGGEDDSPCHSGLTTREHCVQCRRVDAARAALVHHNRES